MSLDPDGGFRYTPPRDFHGVDTFTYKANGSLVSADAVVRITVTSTLDADLDIKPGSQRNRINLRRKGVLPVAILSTPIAIGGETLDARNVDPSSIRFGDPRFAERVTPSRHKLIDLNRDGLLDLLVHFSIPAIRQSGALRAGSTEATVTGFVRNAGGELTPFEGRDFVQVVPRLPVVASIVLNHGSPQRSMVNRIIVNGLA